MNKNENDTFPTYTPAREVVARSLAKGDRISVPRVRGLATVESVENNHFGTTVHLSTLTMFRTRAFHSVRFERDTLVVVYP
jgi:hypothetical protein